MNLLHPEKMGLLSYNEKRLEWTPASNNKLRDELYTLHRHRKDVALKDESWWWSRVWKPVAKLYRQIRATTLSVGFDWYRDTKSFLVLENGWCLVAVTKPTGKVFPITLFKLCESNRRSVKTRDDWTSEVSTDSVASYVDLQLERGYTPIAGFARSFPLLTHAGFARSTNLAPYAFAPGSCDPAIEELVCSDVASAERLGVNLFNQSADDK